MQICSDNCIQFNLEHKEMHVFSPIVQPEFWKSFKILFQIVLYSESLKNKLITSGGGSENTALDNYKLRLFVSLRSQHTLSSPACFLLNKFKFLNFLNVGIPAPFLASF